jgi:hypothetical protein
MQTDVPVVEVPQVCEIQLVAVLVVHEQPFGILATHLPLEQ